MLNPCSFDACLYSGLSNPGMDQHGWEYVYGMLKPGAFLAVVASSHSHHRVAEAVEVVGFEIRDTILFVFEDDGGNPENLLISLARKPFKGTLGANVVQWGTGGLNIDECRICAEGEDFSNLKGRPLMKLTNRRSDPESLNGALQQEALRKLQELGRWPCNVILDNGDIIKQQFPQSKGGSGNGDAKVGEPGKLPFRGGNLISRNDCGSASRYFYNITEENKMEGLCSYLQKLISPPNSKTLLIGFN